MRAAIALAIAAVIFSAPLAAEIYVVKLVNGNEFETRYRPREAGWDADKVVLVTDVGNPISLAKASIVSVQSRGENRGFGRVIDNTTFELGFAPNDAPDAEEGSPDQVQAFMNALQQSQGEAPNYNVQQFVEPSGSAGLPVSWVAPSPTPPTGTVVFQGNAAAPPPPPEQ